jgi:hypothetical protein
VLRNFLGEGEGGTDKAGLVAIRARLALLPEGALPRQIEELKGTDPGDRIRAFALQQVLLFQIEPGGPRDLVLRGQFEDASKAMVPQLELFRIQADKLKVDPDVFDQFSSWKNKLFEAYGKESEAKEALRKGGSQEAVEVAAQAREQVWKSGMQTLGLLVEGGTAEFRRSQVMYQQGLCMHEQAERLQARADALARAEPPPDAAEKEEAHDTAQTAWRNAAGWWTNYTQSYPRTPHGVQARLLLAHVREAQGKPDEARAQLEKVTPDFGELNHISRLYLARRLKAP